MLKCYEIEAVLDPDFVNAPYVLDERGVAFERDAFAFRRGLAVIDGYQP